MEATSTCWVKTTLAYNAESTFIFSDAVRWQLISAYNCYIVHRFRWSECKVWGEVRERKTSCNRNQVGLIGTSFFMVTITISCCKAKGVVTRNVRFRSPLYTSSILHCTIKNQSFTTTSIWGVSCTGSSWLEGNRWSCSTHTRSMCCRQKRNHFHQHITAKRKLLIITGYILKRRHTSMYLVAFISFISYLYVIHATSKLNV